MKYINLGGEALSASDIALGCMRINRLSPAEASRLIGQALENGINCFDHADIYGGGTCEEVFAGAASLTPSAREKVILQTKCGIRQGFFDFSREHILSSAEGSLKRLNTEYIDVYLLHRPDTLMEPEEVAEAFTKLHESGKVRYFGVSNQNPGQMELLSRYLDKRLIVNQLQLSVTNTEMIDAGLNVNMQADASVNRDGGILDYCRLKDITIQAWSPLQYGFFEGVFLGNEKFPELNEKIDELAGKYAVPAAAIAIAWILRHPARMQAVVGTTNAPRLNELCQGSDIALTRPEWYELYRAAGNTLP